MHFFIAAMIVAYYLFGNKMAETYFGFYTRSHQAGIQLASAKRQLENALEEAVLASESKTRFLASASHDLRQPIHTLSLFSAALSLQNLDDKTKVISQRMESSIKTLADQMDALLDISKLDAGAVECNKSDFNLSKVMSQMVSDFAPIAEEKGLRLVKCFNNSDASVYSDPQLFGRIVQNILGNAVKYTDSGSIKIEIQQVSDELVLIISDTGKGIENSNLNKIFDEFFQIDNHERDRTKGLGLGLAIVKRLCSILDFKLSLKSKFGKGTTVSLTLPVSKKIQLSQSAVEDPEYSVVGLDVLFVDDEEFIREAIKALLTEMGCLIRVTGSLDGAIELVGDRVPDILVSDLRLSETQTGIDVVKKIRSLVGDLPVVIISGETDVQSLRTVAAEGLTLLTKPIGGDQLKITLGKTYRDFMNERKT